jgi:hypothetical protein
LLLKCVSLCGENVWLSVSMNRRLCFYRCGEYLPLCPS